MASDENVNRNSCVHDPNFAIVCSFFEKFSSLCGIKHPPFSDLQQMLDSTDEISPELIDLHIRLMRKAKKNVNPDRWQRTLAKFCYLNYPQDCWELEQNGYKNLDFGQRLKILLCVCEAQFDYNIKFKNDVNKLPIDELRLSPIGKDKNGIKYWIHTDEKLELKVYKENLEEETFELIATDRAGLLNIIEMLKSVRDPNRKYEEPSEEDDSDEEVEEEEEEDDDDEGEDEMANKKGEQVENESSPAKNEPSMEKSTTKSKANEESVKTQPPFESQPQPVSSNAPVVEVDPFGLSIMKVEPSMSVHFSKADVSLPKKSHVDIKSRRFDKSPEVKLKKDKVVSEPMPKQLKPEEFAQHIEKLKSEKILLPLLSSPLPFPEPSRGGIDSLKTKINMKFNMIKPVLTNEVLMSKLEEVNKNKDLYKKVVVKREDNTINNYVMQMNKGKESMSRAGKPGLKLEQILKSKLAQKLAAHEPTSESVDPAVESSLPEMSTSTEAVTGDSSKTEPPVDNAIQPSTPDSFLVAKPNPNRKLSQEVKIETKKAKLCNANDEPTDYTKNLKQNDDTNAGEIEEPLMLITGVGSGAECQSVYVSENQHDDDEREFILFVNGAGSGVDCDSLNGDEDEDEREFCLFISGPGLGVECLTGNNETTAEQSSDKEKPAALTHKVENILSSKTEVDEDQTTSVSSSEETPKKSTLPATDDSAEKKKPKLWTIDAICNSDSSKESAKKEDISCFPNFSFNKDKKLEMSYRNEFSFFNMPRSEPKENDAMPTNFYFGSDTQIPPYVATDVRNTNNIKAAKSHNVKDIVQLDKEENKQSQAQVYSTFTNSHTEQAFNLCTRQSPPTVSISTEIGSVKVPETVYSNVMSLSTSNDVIQNQNESKNSADIIIRNDPSSSGKYTDISPERNPDDEIESESRLILTPKFVKDKTHEEELPSIAQSVVDVFSKTKQNLELTSEIATTVDKSKPTEILPEQDIPIVSELAVEPDTVKDVPVETMLKSDLLKDVEMKESIGNGSISKDILVPPKIETSQPESVYEKDVKLSKVDENEKSIERVVENSTKSDFSEEGLLKDRFESIQEPSPNHKLVQDISPESQSLCQETVTEPEINLETARGPFQTIDEINEPQPDHIESDKIIVEKQELSSISIELVDSKDSDVKPVSEESKDLLKEPHLPAFESQESDDDYSPVPSPSSPEPVTEERISLESVETKPVESDSDRISDEEERKKKIKVDITLEPPKEELERPQESITEDTKFSTEEPQEEPEPAIKTESSVTHLKLEPKSDIAIEENLPAAKETFLSPLEEPLKEPEQIIEQNITPSDEENQTPAEDELKSVEEKTCAIITLTPEKKSKKSKLLSEEPTRTSSRITRSTRKDSVSKKEEGGEDDKKSAKTTLKAKQAELKTGKKGKVAAKLTKQASAAEEEEKVEIPVPFTPPVTSKYIKRTGKGRKKWGRGAKTASAKATSTKAPDTEFTSDENGASEDEDKATREVAEKETKPKNPSKTTPKKEKELRKNENETEPVEENEEGKKPEKTPKTMPSKKKAGKRGWFTELDVSNMESSASATPIRQSRRIAQLKIKEQAEGKYIDQITPTKKSAKTEPKSKQQVSVKKNKTSGKKLSKSKTIKEDSDGDDSNYERSAPSKKKRKKKDPKKKIKAGHWKGGSDSSSEEEAEDDDHFEEDEDDEEIVLNDASDHEFSPESDLEDEDFQPIKRARTAHSKPKTEEDKSERDDLCCQKCRTAEQPEWILLCDKCDEGWHALCLRPPLTSIPEGDWFCPPCQHNMLINNLHKFLKTYDKKVKKRDNEELRRQRLQYVGISTTNIIADFSKITSDEVSSKTLDSKGEDESDDRSSDEEESEGDEPLYTLRVRRQANVSYTLKEYDEIMNSAIQRETNDEDEVPQLIPAFNEIKPDEEAVAEKPDVEESKKPDNKKDEEGSSEEEDESKEEKVGPVVNPLFRNIRKKSARLTKLDVSSDDDHYSDEDFKGSSAEDYDEDEYVKSETDSDEARYRKSIREPVRRSTRARVTRYDNDFINDDDSDEEDFEPKKKKKKSRNSDSNSEEEDSTWGKRKRSKYSRVHRSSKKKRRRVVFDGDSEEEKERKAKKAKRSKITYGLEVEEDDYPQRRTRGRKINYLENLGSDSEEDNKPKSKLQSRKIVSDDDDYVGEEDEPKPAYSASKADTGNTDAGDQIKKKTITSSSKLENGTKNDVGECSNGSSKIDSTNLQELMGTNNMGVIRTYSKTGGGPSPASGAQKSKVEPSSSVDPNDLATANKLMPSGLPQLPPMIAPHSEPLQVYSGLLKEDNKMAPKKIDSTNPSLEGMQSMAQSIPQMMSTPSNYSMARKMMPMAGDPGQYASSNPYGDVSIAYEDSADGMVGPPPIPSVEVLHPLRGVPPMTGPSESRLGPIPPTGPPQMGPRPPHMAPGAGPPHMPPGAGPPHMPPGAGHSHMPPGAGPPHISPAGGPPPYMGPGMVPQMSPVGMMHRGSRPPISQIPPQMAAAMHMRAPRPQPPHGALPNIPPMNQTSPSPNQSIETNEPTPKKRGARGKGKKQLAAAAAAAAAVAAAAAAATTSGKESSNPVTDEMIPLHMLKPLSGPDVNSGAANARPNASISGTVSVVSTTVYNNSPSSTFTNYPPPATSGAPNQMARLPYSTASSTTSGAVTVSVGNNPSKRVKITPTRMRMPGNSTQNVMRFPARPSQSGQMMHAPHMPLDPSPSGGGLVTVNSSVTTITENSPSGTSPNTSAEIDTNKRPSSTQPPQSVSEPPHQPSHQYYQPPPYPPLSSANQISRGGFNQRPDFAGFPATPPGAAPKPMPSQQSPQSTIYSHPGSVLATTGAPTTVISRPATTNTSVISGQMSTSTVGAPAGPPPLTGKADPVTPVSSTASYSASSYVPATAAGAVSLSTSKAANVAIVTATSTAAGSVPPPIVSTPPSSAYQALHMKQLPPQPQAAHSAVPSYNPASPYYAVAPMVPNSYPPPSPRPPISSAYGPPPPGSMAFPASNRQPSFVKSPPQQTGIPYGTPPASSAGPDLATGSAPSAEYEAGGQQVSAGGFQYQEPVTGAANDEGQFQTGGYDEESSPTQTDEQPSGEFGGLVSYFSSQREDDLDA